ncbi:Tetratricopeptide repeat protein [Rubripirellula reticaptiva]|uniref:Tetratricopeptide repeat protein n=2 Tax=Rubripirellula reticaptiva TaxID=2528013 RepID=A0A5C6EI02_9BACT|nr:Tetratricopeptide repeat protein [Rubripirellula reticaptiva]
MIEIGLAVLGLPKDRVLEDPYVGFSSQIPLMKESIDEQGQVLMVTAPEKLRLFNPQSFAAKKPTGVKRIFCVGGSTTFGRPFDDATSYSGYLRKLLPETGSSNQWEVINAGGVSYASYRVASVMEELVQFEPDIFIVYSAHNEFLERRTYAGLIETPRWKLAIDAALRKTRTFAVLQDAVDEVRGRDDSPIEMLPGEVDERLNHTVGPVDYVRDDAWTADVLRHYRSNLERMISIARHADAAIVFVEPSCNEKDCAPFKSDDDHFERGTGFFEQGLFDEASDEFLAAIDRDICSLRATSAIREIVREVSSENGVPLVRFNDLLHTMCETEYGHSCLGNEYFLDHVHPTVDVHGKFARQIIETLVRSGQVDGTVPDTTATARVDAAIRGAIDVDDQAIAFRNLAKVLHWAGKFSEAQRSAEDALRLRPSDPESLFVLADCLTQQGRPNEAIERYEQLFEVAEYERAILPFAFVLADAGHLETAKFYATLATASEKLRTREAALDLLVSIHLSLGEDQLAAEAGTHLSD